MTPDQVVQLIQALAWPITVLILVLLFRGEIRNIFARISAFHYKDFKAEFARELHAAEGEIQELLTEATSPENSATRDGSASFSSVREGEERYESLMRIAELSPQAAIMEAWREIELTIKTIANRWGLSKPGHMPGERDIKYLVDKGLLPRGALGVYQRLRRLRTKAAHAPNLAVEVEEAQNYIEAAREFLAILRFLLRHGKPGSTALNRG